VSFHMHLRATTSNEAPEDFSSLRDVMWAAWEDHQQEFAAGIAESIEKDFGHLHKLYTMGADESDATNAASTLPIFGGRHIPSPTKDQPPFVILNPAEVRGAADFLMTVSFDERWRAAGTYNGWEDENRNTFLGYHTDLRTFYGRAALAGHTVIKAFWY
jgi:hypothetical protein